MSLPIGIELANVQTHQSDFTRGYWVGWVQAMVSQCDDFECLVPDAFLDDVLTVLPEGTAVDPVWLAPNQYDVVFVRLRVLRQALPMGRAA